MRPERALRRNLARAHADTQRMHPAPSPSAAWHLRELELGRIHLERRAAGVLVRLELYSGGGFVASTAVWRVAGSVVAIVEAGEA